MARTVPIRRSLLVNLVLIVLPPGGAILALTYLGSLLDYDPRERPWFQGALNQREIVHWTEPYIIQGSTRGGRPEGSERGRRYASLAMNAAASEIMKQIREAVEQFTLGEPPADDRTGIVIKRA